jgi:hypothetical protein
MANRRFETAVVALWARLGMPAPSFDAADAVTLTVDGTAIALAESRDSEGILVSASPGRLAADPFRQGEQVSRLLRANLGFLVGNRAGVCLIGDGPEAVVRVEADWRYEGGTAASSAENLAKRVEDVLQLVEFHQPELTVRPTARPAPAGAADDVRGEFIIRL